MSFNAGDIEASLLVDRTPFTTGLDEASADVRRFIEHPYSASLALDEGNMVERLDDLKLRLNELDFIKATARVGVDYGDSFEMMGYLDETVDEFGRKSVTAKVKVDASAARLGLDDLLIEIEKSQSAVGGLSRVTSNAEQGMSGLLATALLLGPGLIPVAVASTGAVLGLGGAIAGTAAGLGAFALAAAPQMGALKDEAKDLLSQFQAIAAPDVLPVIAKGADLLEPAFASLFPLVDTTSAALLGFENRADKALNSPTWHGFTTWLAAEAGPGIRSFTDDLGYLGAGTAALLQDFSPMVDQMEGGLERLTRAYDQWAQSGQGPERFLDYVEREGPLVVGLLQNLVTLSGHALEVFGGWGTVLLTVADPLLTITNTLLRLNPELGTAAAAVTLGAVAWGKWGTGIKGAISDARNLGAIVTGTQAAESALGSLALTTGKLGNVMGQAKAAAEAEAIAQANAATAAKALAFEEDALALAYGRLVIAEEEAAAAAKGLAGAQDGASVAGDGAAAAALGLRGGLTALLPTLAPIAIGVGGIALAMYRSDLASQQLTGHTAELVKGIQGMGATTLPELQNALTSNASKISELKQRQQDLLRQSGLTQAQIHSLSGELDKGAESTEKLRSQVGLHETALVDVSLQIEKYTEENKKLNAELTTQQHNLDLLNNRFGLTQASADSLASSIGINLNQKLTQLQLVQVKEYLAQLAGQSGLTQSALEKLAIASGRSVEEISKDIATSQQTTAAAFEQADSLIGTFAGQLSVTHEQIGLFYLESENDANNFTANIQKAIQDGYDPQLIASILEAGPSQAGPLLASMVSDASASFVQLVNDGQKALTAVETEGVEMSRLMREAVDSNSQQMTNDLSTALQVSQQQFAQGATATVESVAAALGVGVATVKSIADEFGIVLPDAINAKQQAAADAGSAQASAFASGLASGQGDTTAAVNELIAAGLSPWMASVVVAGDIGTITAQQWATNAAGQTGFSQTKYQALVDAGMQPLAAMAIAAGNYGDVTGHGYASAIDGRVPESAAAGRHHADAVKGGLDSGVGPATISANTLGSSIFDGFGHDTSGHPLDFRQVGENMVDGIIGGLGDKAGDLVHKAESVIGDAVGAMKDFLHINSPSRLTRELIGWNWGLGVIAGLEDQQAGVNQAARSLVGGGVDAMAAIAASPAAGLGGAWNAAARGPISVTAHFHGVNMGDASAIRAELDRMVADAIDDHDDQQAQLKRASGR